MAARRGLIALVLVAGASIATACRGGSGSTGTAPSTDARPPSGNVVSGSSGVAGGSSSSSGASNENPDCPTARSAGTSVEELDEAMLRASLPGVYGGCHMPTNLELRIDAATDRIVFYSLDDRFVRNGTSGWIEIGSCSGDTCQIIQHYEAHASSGSGSGAETQSEQLTLWMDPVAIKMTYAEWVRLAD